MISTIIWIISANYLQLLNDSTPCFKRILYSKNTFDLEHKIIMSFFIFQDGDKRVDGFTKSGPLSFMQHKTATNLRRKYSKAFDTFFIDHTRFWFPCNCCRTHSSSGNIFVKKDTVKLPILACVTTEDIMFYNKGCSK